MSSLFDVRGSTASRPTFREIRVIPGCPFPNSRSDTCRYTERFPIIDHACVYDPHPCRLRDENPRRISPTGARLTVSCAYRAQQGGLTGQQAPPPQQSAEREVAFAVPTSARAATIISRYFIRILPLNFVLHLVPQFARDEPTPLSNGKSRRWNLRTMRPD
jgi:hypothetical protein